MEYVFVCLFNVSMLYSLTLLQLYISFKCIYGYSLALISSYGSFPETLTYFILIQTRDNNRSITQIAVLGKEVPQIILGRCIELSRKTTRRTKL